MCFLCINLFILHALICPLSLSLGVRDWLRLVIVALFGFFF